MKNSKSGAAWLIASIVLAVSCQRDLPLTAPRFRVTSAPPQVLATSTLHPDKCFKISTIYGNFVVGDSGQEMYRFPGGVWLYINGAFQTTLDHAIYNDVNSTQQYDSASSTFKIRVTGGTKNLTNPGDYFQAKVFKSLGIRTIYYEIRAGGVTSNWATYEVLTDTTSNFGYGTNTQPPFNCY